MQHFTGNVLDDKPRPFDNAMHVGWGSGSCYLNAALQFLFSAAQVRWILAEIISADVLRTNSFSEKRWRFCTTANISDIRSSKSTRNGFVNDRTLALTFAASMQGRSSTGESLRGLSLYPALYLRENYDGRQEDATLFLMDCLDTSPRTLSLFTGRYRPAVLQCDVCGQAAPSGGHADERKFTTLQIQADFADVQVALEASYTETLDEEFLECCTNPQCGHRWTHKHQVVEEPPRVLLMQIKRWDYSSGMPQRLASSMSLNSSIIVAGVTYHLHGIIYHNGDSPKSGHYVAAARHNTASDSFMVYNDAHRQGVPVTTLASTMPLPGSWKCTLFHATTLLYERAS